MRRSQVEGFIPSLVFIKSPEMTANTEKTTQTEKTAKVKRVATPLERLGISILRLRLGAALQRHRLDRGMTQAELAEFSDLSLKYVGEIERGDANTTLEVLERLAAAVGWDPMETLEGLREPLSEGVRLLLLQEVHQMGDRLRNMSKWLQALDPALQPKTPPAADGKPALPEGEPRRIRHARPTRLARKRLQEQLRKQEEERLAQRHLHPQAPSELESDADPG